MFTKNLAGILIGIALKIYIIWGRIFTMLNLPIREHYISFTRGFELW